MTPNLLDKTSQLSDGLSFLNKLLNLFIKLGTIAVCIAAIYTAFKR